MIEYSCLKKTRISFLLSKEIYYYIKVSNSMINLGFINEIYYIYILSSKKYLLQFWLDKDIIKERQGRNDRTLVLEFRGTRSGLGTRGGAACEHSCHSLVRHHPPQMNHFTHREDPRRRNVACLSSSCRFFFSNLI